MSESAAIPIRKSAPERRGDGPSIATVLGRSAAGVLIELDGRTLEARLAVADPVEDAIGSEVLVEFIAGDPERPVIIGLLRAPRPSAPAPDGKTIEIDAEQFCVNAQRELVLRCGKGSIRLTRDGRIVIDGVQLVSRAEGANRIRGGTIHLN
jgi:hypothetical protein